MLTAQIYGDVLASSNVMTTKLYSKKVVVGIAASTAVLAGLVAFAIGWTRTEGPSDIIWPRS